MRIPSAIRLISAAIVFSQSHFVLFGQSAPIEPLKVSVCELLKEPTRFAGKLVEFRSLFVSRFEWEGIVDESCAAKIQVGGFHVYDELKPEQGQYAFTKTSEDDTHPERLEWKPIEPLLPVNPKLDENFRKFRQYADTKFKWPDGGICRDCPLYRIDVTAIARFDYFETQTVSVRANPQTKAFSYSSGDDPSAPLLRLVLQSVVEVSASPISPSTYSLQKRRDLTLEEEDALVTAFFKDRGSTKLRGFELDKYSNPYYPEFQFFQGIFDNPGGSFNLGHYAVDRKTGDVWDGVICSRVTSPSLTKLQLAIRNRIGLAREDYRKAQKSGPMCDSDEKPPVEKAK